MTPTVGDASPGGREVDRDFADYVAASALRHKRLAFLLTQNVEAAEDLLQAAYAKVYPRWGQVRDYDSPDAYLRRVMVNLRTSWWRRAWPHEVPLEGHADSGAIPDHGDRVAQNLALLAALRQLPPRQRAAVVLRHWCDLSEAEVAATMGCSVGTVKSSTSKGLARLRLSLAQDEEAQP